MNRPHHVWTWFALALGVVLITLAGVSALVVRLEKREHLAQAEADREQRFRLALWRLDAAVAIVLATENARPPADYLAPSVLEAGSPEPIQWHFQLGPGAEITSPNPSPERQAALQRLLMEPAARQSFKWSTNEVPRIGSAERDKYPLSNRAQIDTAAENQATQPPSLLPSPSLPNRSYSNSKKLPVSRYSQTEQNINEVNARSGNLANALKQSQMLNVAPTERPGLAPLARDSGKEPRTIGLLSPVWLGDDLFLVRRIGLALGGDRIQGAWVDWPRWSALLTASVDDLVSGARLIPVANDTIGGEERRLVALPLRLEAGTPELNSYEFSTAWTPIRIALLCAWVSVLGAAAATAWLLHGTLALSERRAAFVSAVTHELRTPLTTFKLYSEMLADDMVPDPTQRRSYLETLRAEASRLGHLVENVLAYARLERGRTLPRREIITVNELIASIRGRLDQRTTQAGIVLTYDLDSAGSSKINVDIGLMEQVFFNLVDNACKYAGPAVVGANGSTWVRISAASFRSDRVALRLQDHGPGVDDSVRRHLFEPFSKSAEQAAVSAPGVGLGLSLCRQLLRSFGGELALESTGPSGTTFRIELPCVGGSG